MEIRPLIIGGIEWWFWFDTEKNEPASPLFETEQLCSDYFKDNFTFH